MQNVPMSVSNMLNGIWRLMDEIQSASMSRMVTRRDSPALLRQPAEDPDANYVKPSR